MKKLPVLLAVTALAGWGIAAHANSSSHQGHGDHKAEHAEHKGHGHEEHKEHAKETHAEAGHEGHDHHAHHGGHEHIHGAAFVTMTLSGNILTAKMKIPGGMFFPEDMPKEDRSFVAASQHFETQGVGLMIPDAANCRVLSNYVEITEITEGEHEGHKDVTGQRIYLCDAPDSFDDITVTAFTSYPKLERVFLSAAHDHFEVKAEVTADAPRLHLTAVSADHH